ncbi:unnamed protein product [Auanema sp. JU1783]|nr:unnamed protein product [Auanema sp. JU1783]
MMKSEKSRKKKILYKCSLGNTISDVLAGRDGWTETTADDWNFFWTTREWMNTTFDRFKFKDRQFVCHFRNDFELTRKDFLIKNYKKAKKSLGKLELKQDYSYIPSSYLLPSEYHLFVEEFRKYPPDTIWIMKPVAGSQGRGIFLFRKLKDIQEWKKKDTHDNDIVPYVVQCYIHNPYLIGGKKFDLRIYVLVTTFRPLTVWVHREGFARFSHSPYSTEAVDNALVHLTNVAIAKTAVDYDPERGLKWSLDKLFRFLRARHGQSQILQVMDDIANIILESLRCVQGLIIQDSHCFEMYGYDVLLDANLKPWLLEVNASPSLTASSTEDFQMKSRVLNNMLDIIDLEQRLNGHEIQVGGFDLLVHEGDVINIPRSGILNRPSTMFSSRSNLRLGDYLESKKACPNT